MVALLKSEEERQVNVISIEVGHMTPELVNLHNRALLAEYELHLERQHVRKVYRAMLCDLLRRQRKGTTTGTEPLEYEHNALQHLVLGEG